MRRVICTFHATQENNEIRTIEYVLHLLKWQVLNSCYKWGFTNFFKEKKTFYLFNCFTYGILKRAEIQRKILPFYLI